MYNVEICFLCAQYKFSTKILSSIETSDVTIQGDTINCKNQVSTSQKNEQDTNLKLNLK